jgi:hypothetical protein
VAAALAPHATPLPSPDESSAQPGAVTGAVAAAADPGQPQPPLSPAALARLAWSGAALHAAPGALATLCAAALRPLGVHPALTHLPTTSPDAQLPDGGAGAGLSQADLAGLAWALVVLQAAKALPPMRPPQLAPPPQQQQPTPSPQWLSKQPGAGRGAAPAPGGDAAALVAWLVGPGGLGAADVVYRAAASRGVRAVWVPHMGLAATTHVALLTARGKPWARQVEDSGQAGGWGNALSFVWDAAVQRAMERGDVDEGGGGGDGGAGAGAGRARGISSVALRVQVAAAMSHDAPHGALAPDAQRLSVGVGPFTGVEVDVAARVGGHRLALLCDGADRFLVGGESGSESEGGLSGQPGSQVAGGAAAKGDRGSRSGVAAPRLRASALWREVVLRQLGFRVLRVPYWEWPAGPELEEHATDAAMAPRIAYLRRKVQRETGLKV